MHLYTVQAFELPTHRPILGQYVDRELALNAAEAALPSCVGSVVVEEWAIAEDLQIVTAQKGHYLEGLRCKRIFQKEGTRKLTVAERESRFQHYT